MAESITHIAVVTSGGDAPGTNAAVRAVARRALAEGIAVSGVLRSWVGAIEGDFISLDRDVIRDVLAEGGTILKSARTDLLTRPGDAETIIAGLEKKGIDAIVTVGGDGSHRGACELFRAGFPVVGIPKTIDNDVAGTDWTIGFKTAVETATNAIDRIRTHTVSNDRVMVVEVMGRNAGWIAAYAGIASGADFILIPEAPWSFEMVAQHLKDRHTVLRRSFSLLVVAEGAIHSQSELVRNSDARTDPLGRPHLSGIGDVLARTIEDRLGYESRCTTLGYLLRGGSPIAEDRVLATRLGVAAVEALLDHKPGVMVGEVGGSIVATGLAQTAGKHKTVPPDVMKLASRFF